MSLYIGNLSARTRRDELENVFRRFGRCNVQMKDGYGFIVYDFPPNADKALRALQGKNICGKPLTLTWSNKQRRPFQKSIRGARSYELHRTRDYTRGGDYARRNIGSQERRHSNSIEQTKNDGERINSAEVIDEEACKDNMNKFVGEEHAVEKDDLPVEVGIALPQPVDNGRWGDQVHDISNDNGVENGVEFDMYEPYQGYDRKVKGENHHAAHSGSSVQQSSQEYVRRNKITDLTLNRGNDLKSRQTCYRCGDAGHKMRNCPRGRAPRRKLTSFDCREGDEIRRRGRGEGELEIFGSKSLGKMHSSRHTTSPTRHRNNKRSKSFREHRWSSKNGSSPVTKEIGRAYWKDQRGMERSNRDTITSRKGSARRARRSVSSSQQSDCSTSTSRSTYRSSKSLQRSRSLSRSQSLSSRRHALPTNSTSSLKSQYSKSKILKSRSRSISPTLLSLSVSLGHSLQSLPNKQQLNLNGSLDDATTPGSKDFLAEQGRTEEGDAGMENHKVENAKGVVNNESTVSSSKEKMENNQPLRGSLVDTHIASPSLQEVENPQLPENNIIRAGSFFSEGERNSIEFQNTDVFVEEKMLAPTNSCDSKPPFSSPPSSSTCISPVEMNLILKHYGLDVPKYERNLSIEDYFGSARLWPWEIIYYRRLKKGPISVENYARRVAQNQEFGIVDKYIRSSSGWGEIGQENP